MLSRLKEELLVAIADPARLMEELRLLRMQHGMVAKRAVGPARSYILFGPDLNRDVLTKAGDILVSGKPWDRLFSFYSSKGLLALDGGEHRLWRRALQSAFAPAMMEAYARTIAEVVEAELRSWVPGRGVSIFSLCEHLVRVLQLRVLLGKSVGECTVRRFFEVESAGSGVLFGGVRARQRRMRRQDSIVGQAVAQGRSSTANAAATALPPQESGSFRMLVSHLRFLVDAAAETTTSALTSVMFELGRNATWQERLREEGAQSALLRAGGIASLPETDWVIREVLRLHPPLGVIRRFAPRRVELGSHEIRANSLVILAPVHTHRMPEFWDDPDRFDPERFSRSRREHRRHTHSWLPFGSGPHHCLGHRLAMLELKLILRALVRRFRWRSEGEYKVQYRPILLPSRALEIDLRRA